MKLQNGRFNKRLDPEALAFSSSIDVDRVLYREDIEGSLAHVAMLGKCKIIPPGDARRIAAGLRSIRQEIESGTFVPGLRNRNRFEAEDIHMAIEARLLKKVGPVGGKLHTARSRNDQVALDLRLFLMREAPRIGRLIRSVQKSLVGKARQYKDLVMPGYTHLQRAQPVLLAHHLLAYVEMLQRDRDRFENAAGRADALPLGAGALAGTSFAIDRRSVARALGFSRLASNSIDAVSDRDAVIEFISAAAITMMHLSRLSEELVLWSTREWGFVELGDAVTTGSSIMPQKKNPDLAELVRGKAGRVYGDLMAILTVMKSLPLAYNRDMQEDKEPLFDATTTVADSLRVMVLLLASSKFNRHRFGREMETDFLLSTELADYLVRKGMPFREAHAIVGGIVRSCIGRRISLGDMTIEEYKKFTPLFSRDLFRVLSPERSIAEKRSEGSTAPREVRKALRKWSVRLRN